jgi:thiol peroxidase
MDVKTISRDELIKLQKSDKPYKLIDVLDTSSYEKGHIPKSISIPLEELREKASVLLNKDELIIVYCANFDCPASTTAAKILMGMGYKNVLDYKGGLKDYLEGNLPLEKQTHSKVTMQNQPLTLVGRKIKIGQNAPQFKVADNNLNEIILDKFKDKIKVITSFLSLDTPVCDLQVKEFNKKAAAFPNTAVLGISKDLPFAQKRFCMINDIKNLTALSDFKTSSFGINYGLLIKENNLLARATVILDTNNIIRFIEVVDEITKEPNYENILVHLKEIINSPPGQVAETLPLKCVPCETETPPLNNDEINKLLRDTPQWQVIDNTKLVREFTFKDFIEAKYFLDLLAIIAEEQQHHPNFTLIYNKLKVTCTTHTSHGLTNNDFVMARVINEVTI